MAVSIAAVVVFGWSGSASASVAEVVFDPGRPNDTIAPAGPTESLVVTGEGEEANLFSAVETDSQTVVVTDAGAGLGPGAGCAAIDPHRVRCSFRLPTRTSIIFEGEAGDDAVDLSSYPEPVRLEGGPGADRLRTPDAGGYANGGPGPDRLNGGPGPETFVDSGPAERDEFDGGGGRNQIAYYTRTASVTVDLTAGVGGEVGEGDLLVDLTGAVGGDGADLLRGSDGPDYLSGGEGSDSLEGGHGDDELLGGTAQQGTHDVIAGGGGNDSLQGAPIGRATMHGGDGNDTLVGGTGADEAYGGNGADSIGTGGGLDVIDAGAGPDRVQIAGERTRVACGEGRDVADPLSLVRPPADCELVRVNVGLEVTRRVRIRGRHALVRLYCSSPANQRICRGVVRLRRGSEGQRREVGSGRFRVPLGHSGVARIRLTRAAVRRYRSDGRLAVSPMVVWRRRTPVPSSFANVVAWTVVAEAASP